MADLDKLFTVEEIANMTSLTTRTIRNYLRDGILKGRKIGGQWRFTSEDIQKFMNCGEVSSDMAKTQKQDVLDFFDGVNTDIDGEIQICTIIDLYVTLELAKQKSDELCKLMSSCKDNPKHNYKYDYVESENKARYTIFASPDFLIDVMNIFK